MDNNKVQKALIAFWLAAGLHMSDQSTGILTQILSWIDPTARGLTSDEIELARPILGDKIDYASVRVFERKTLDTVWHEWLGGNPRAGTAQHHFIYLHEIKDFDQQEAAKDGYKGYPNRKLLIHELTHVGQYQNRISHTGAEKDYSVTIEPGKPFTAYKLEQQATLTENYYEAWRKVGQLSTYFDTRSVPADEQAERIARACQDAEAIAAAIRPHFPARPHPVCINFQIPS